MNITWQSLRKNFHWPSISRAFWLFAISVVFAGSIAFFATLMLKVLQDKNQTENNNLYDIQQAYSDTLREIQLIEEYKEPYEQLARKGFTGQEDRLSRVEVMKQVRQARNLPSLSYTFKPARQIQDYYGLKADSMTIYSTENAINFTLYDESDLVLMLSQLNANAHGIYLVEDCQLKRPIKELQLATAGNLYGSCSLNWLSLRAVSGDAVNGDSDG